MSVRLCFLASVFTLGLQLQPYRMDFISGWRLLRYIGDGSVGIHAGLNVV